MALHINLYHEIHKQAEQERRDPVKIASLGLLLVLLALVLWYFYRASAVRQIESRASDLKSQWAKIEPQLKASLAKEPQLQVQQKNNQELIDRLHGRFYWAPFLAQLQALVPANVQIIAINGEAETAKQEGTRGISILLKGVAAGTLPRAAAEEFRQGLLSGVSQAGYSDVSASFDANSLEDGLELVQINGQNLPTANFRIRVAFKQPATAPAATPSK